MLGAVCFLFLTLEVTLLGAEADEGQAWAEAADWPGPGKGIVCPSLGCSRRASGPCWLCVSD